MPKAKGLPRGYGRENIVTGERDSHTKPEDEGFRMEQPKPIPPIPKDDEDTNDQFGRF